MPFPSLGDLPDPGIEPRSPTLQADSLPSEPLGKPSCIARQILNHWAAREVPPSPSSFLPLLHPAVGPKKTTLYGFPQLASQGVLAGED